MTNVKILLLVFSFTFTLTFSICDYNDSKLHPYYYFSSCPNVEKIVMSIVRGAVVRETRMAASLMSLHFHDCFVQGCDGSVLLDSSGGIVSEKNSHPNNNLICGFDVIEDVCPGTVSYVDALTLAARASSVLTGGPSWIVPLGRRDSTSASLSGSNNNRPAPNHNFDTILLKFLDQGLDLTDMVALSGSHTIGFSQCSSFKKRLYEDSGNGSDPSLDQTYANYLHIRCPTSGGDQILFDLDVDNSLRFDNNYFRKLVTNLGQLNSDQVFFSSNENSNELVRRYADDQEELFKQFPISMVKMGNISSLTGLSGEIRKIYRKVTIVNPYPMWINGQNRDDICFWGKYLLC